MSELMHAAADHFGWALAGLVVIVALVVRAVVSIFSISPRERV